MIIGVNQLGSDTTPISGGRFGKGGLNDTRVARGMEKQAKCVAQLAGSTRLYEIRG